MLRCDQTILRGETLDWGWGVSQVVFQLLKSSLKEKMCLHAAGAVALDHRTEQVVFRVCVFLLLHTPKCPFYLHKDIFGKWGNFGWSPQLDCVYNTEVGNGFRSEWLVERCACMRVCVLKECGELSVTPDNRGRYAPAQ